MGASDIRLPTGLCGFCRSTLANYSKGDFSKKLPNTFDYSSIVPPPYPTRANTNTDCCCTICVLCKEGKFSRQEVGQFSFKNEDQGVENDNMKSNCLKLCSHCLSSIGKGKQHICTKTKFYDNILQMTQHGPAQASEKIASKIIKQKRGILEEKTDQIFLSQERGRPLPIQIGHKT